MASHKEWVLFTDGSSGARSGRPGGWAWILTQGTDLHCHGYGSDPATSNNRMEITAAIKGLEAWLTFPLRGQRDQLWLASDSQLVLGFASGAFDPTTNKDLVSRLRELAIQTGLLTRWVPGHQIEKLRKRGEKDWTKYPFEALVNNRCDQLAKMAKESVVVSTVVNPKTETELE